MEFTQTYLGLHLPAKRVVAVELKLALVQDAMWQAIHHRNYANECWIAMPTERFRAMGRGLWWRLTCGGLGVLGVDGEAVQVLHDPLVCVPPNTKRFERRLWNRRAEYLERMKNPECLKVAPRGDADDKEVLAGLGPNDIANMKSILKAARP